MPNPRTIEVLITSPLPDVLIKQIESVSPNLNISLQVAGKVEDIPEEVWNKTEVLFTQNLIPSPESIPNMRWIQYDYAGVEFLRDAPMLELPDLVVTNMSGASMAQVAEYSVTMMLALGHHMRELIASQAQGEWPEDRWTRFQPLELRGSTVGIAGYGSIGREIARLVQPFGVSVLAAKKDVMRPEDRGYVPEGLGDPGGDLFTRLYPIQALRSMVRECDFFVVALPHTPETINVVDKEVLEAMKSTACLINVSRGGVVDESALEMVLKERRIAGAAMDVFAEEPLPEDHPLWKLENLIITPHIAGASAFYQERAVEMFVSNLERYINGAALFNRYDTKKGY